ncbi:basic salivary proline-rich protein 3-like [Calypte anna]|uniref:basic salivary proline-rich protein 3-like n=1 Tax=Calypte anna TaxID=9244 RepID=UPI0011C38309|nr:basic salivary proline-rich protein 3-like [Calypte anna]
MPPACDCLKEGTGGCLSCCPPAPGQPAGGCADTTPNGDLVTEGGGGGPGEGAGGWYFPKHAACRFPPSAAPPPEDRDRARSIWDGLAEEARTAAEGFWARPLPYAPHNTEQQGKGQGASAPDGGGEGAPASANACPEKGKEPGWNEGGGDAWKWERSVSEGPRIGRNENPNKRPDEEIKNAHRENTWDRSARARTGRGWSHTLPTHRGSRRGRSSSARPERGRSHTPPTHKGSRRDRSPPARPGSGWSHTPPTHWGSRRDRGPPAHPGSGRSHSPRTRKG